jgi:hypothetical protein
MNTTSHTPPTPAPPPRRVELGSVEVRPDGESFVLGFGAPNHEQHRFELPRWAVHQLMRMLPRLDAALLQARQQLTSELIAYPVVQWHVEATGAGDTVALSLRTDRATELAFLLDGADARAIGAALAQAPNCPTGLAPEPAGRDRATSPAG